MSSPLKNLVNTVIASNILQKSASPPLPLPPPTATATTTAPTELGKRDSMPEYKQEKKGRIEIAFTQGNNAGKNVQVTFGEDQAVLTSLGNGKIDLTSNGDDAKDNLAKLDLLRKLYNAAPDTATTNGAPTTTNVTGGNGRKKRSLTHKRRNQQKKRVRKSMRH